ncbi:glycoside hydrolase family 95 protein [Actinoplanes awajinensis]|uniref:Alpha-L-fucosidase n=1 Tax=Actinoplanes awajinensis subsp. mycoplanecinus TaxID=135947 RepID=A0A101JBG1_9ACTN|nr:glycoside hydrolase family 95 protein [Actinoplanes awajinensis]KUL23683.1 alpha-L-fucosidase [Actinoplanes awajinensis subsp. mycoplanecinus]
MSSSVLYYDRPAERWFEALPIGNGRLGGMVHGGIGTEIIRLSESTAWSGAPTDGDVSPTALRELPAIRRLLFDGKFAEAQQLATEHLPGRPTNFGTNVPLPRLRLDFAEHAAGDYRRSLDLDTGLATIKIGHFVREVFASHPHGVIAMRLSSSRPAAISFSATLDDTVLPGATTTTEDGLAFSGRAVESLHSNGRDGVAVEIRARFQLDGGTLSRDGDTITVTGADAVVVLIAAGTDWAGSAQLVFPAAGYDVLRSAHIADHQRLMRRVSIDLGEPVALPTDVRRNRLAEGHRDDDLIALYFQYGRYLTIAGSREDSPLPLALQGVWNDGFASSMGWSNDFHLDINTQQNYWATESTNLAECHAPLIRFVQRLASAGRRTAREMYDADGWVAHTVTNAWGYTAPGSGIGWGMNVTGGAWIALQLWEHYEYQPDEDYLRDEAYPVLRDAALFLLSYLTPEPTHGWLVPGPAESPENWYLAPDGTPCSVAMGATSDRVLTEAILRICAQAATILGVDADLRDRISAARERLSEFRIGRHGQLQEWLDDFDEADPAHRHTAHLVAVFPERQISPRRTPELARAAAVTLERRQQAPGWEQTEWVEANFAAFHARLLDGDQALVHVTRLIADTSEANLLSYSAGGIAGAPQNIYSFDGNAGGTGAIAEMLLQSDGEEIELLPALPSTWRDGSVRGLRARGGFTVDLTWRDGELLAARILSDTATTTRVRYRNATTELTCKPGQDLTVERQHFAAVN